MANIQYLSGLIEGVERNINISTNTLVASAVTVGGLGGTTLTQTILNNLISLMSNLASTTSGSAGSTYVGDDNSYSNFTPVSATVKGALSGIDSALATVGKTNFSDSVFYVYSSADSTKHINFSASSITTGNTRTITMPDSNVNLGLISTALQANGSVTATANQNFGGFRLTNVGNAVAGTDAINLNQFQNFQAGVQWRPEANLYDNVDTSLPTTTATLIDGVTVTNGMRVLFVNLSSNNNEIYTAAVSGSAITWTAALDNDRTNAAAVTGDCVLILQGTSYAESAWNYNGTAFVQFNGAGQIQAGSGLSKSGNTLSVLALSGSAIAVSGSGVSVNVSASGGIQVSSSALSLYLADTSLTTSSSGVKVNLQSGTSGLAVSSGLFINTDGVTTAVNGSNQLYVLAAGVGKVQLNSNAFDQTTITGGAGSSASVAYAPAVKQVVIAGQSFSANTTYALRWGIPANGETATRCYAADYTTSTTDNFWVIGLFNSPTAITSGGTITMTVKGLLSLGSSDTSFGSSDQGRPFYLGASGAYLPYSTQPTTSGSGLASVKLGIAQNGSTAWVDIQVIGVL